MAWYDWADPGDLLGFGQDDKVSKANAAVNAFPQKPYLFLLVFLLKVPKHLFH